MEKTVSTQRNKSYKTLQSFKAYLSDKDINQLSELFNVLLQIDRRTKITNKYETQNKRS